MDSRFTELLRPYLPFLGDGGPIPPDLELRDAGLDSLATVDLLSAIERDYDIRFRESAMNRDTFRTPATLWAEIEAVTHTAV